MPTTTSPAFTPGPWIIEHRSSAALPNDDAIDFIMGADRQHVCVVDAWLNGHADTDTNTANAHLIKAAPLMYAALEECVRWLSKAQADEAFANCVLPHAVEDYALPKAYAALALARGEG